MSRGALRGVKWHRLVCDEAAFIKNLDTQRAKAVHRLKKSHVWLATGSPVQNNIKELQTLLRLCKFSGAKHKTHLYIKCNILPRQARDKHRENSKKRIFFDAISC
jgi:SWI/SNF-related matrix-associated actin-dependent regulator of chromatin subfamily A3